MNRSIPLTAAAAGGGMLAAAFLSTAVAVADTDTGENDAATLTADGLTFTPDEDTDINYIFNLAPLFSLSDTDDVDIDVARGDDDLGTFTSDLQGSTIFGVETTSFTFDADSFEPDGGAGDTGGGGSVDADAIADALTAAGYDDSDVDGGDLSIDDLAHALAGSDLDFSSDNFTAGEIFDAVAASDYDDVADDLDTDEGNFEFGGEDHGAGLVATALNDNLEAGDGGAGDLPADGTIYSFTDFGSGFGNIYEAAPAEDGGLPDITDTFTTPFGDFDLSAPFNFFANIFGGLFGGGGDEGGGGAGDPGDVENALYDHDTDFSQGDLPALLYGDDLDFGSGDVTGSDIIDALNGTAVADALDIENGDFSDVDFSPGDLATVVNNMDTPSDAGDVENALYGSDTGFSAVNLPTVLADDDLNFGSDITASDVLDALRGTGVGDDVLDIEGNGFDDVDFTPGDIADALNAGDIDAGGGGGLFDGLF